MALHPGERRGAKGTDLGGQFVGPKSIARFLVKLLRPEPEHKPGQSEPDMRRTMGRTVTAGGSVISSRLPERAARVGDRVVDTRDPRRMGTVAHVLPDGPNHHNPRSGGSHRIHWDDGTVSSQPPGTVTPPLREPARSFDAHPLSTSPAVRKMTAPAAPSTPKDKLRRHLADEVAAGRVDSRQAAAAMRDVQDPSRAPLSATDRGHHITSDPSLTDRQKRARLKSMGMTPEEVDSLVPTAAKKASPAAAKMARGKAGAADRAEAAKVASAFHEDWRKTRLQPDGSFEPRVKTTKDQAWIGAHGTDQVDIANSTYDQLPEDWKAENKAAAEVVQGILKQHGGTVDLSDEKTRLAVGEEVHQAWLSRNEWAKGGELDVPFADLTKSEQDKDTDQLKVAMAALSGNARPRTAKKASTPARTAGRRNRVDKAGRFIGMQDRTTSAGPGKLVSITGSAVQVGEGDTLQPSPERWGSGYNVDLIRPNGDRVRVEQSLSSREQATARIAELNDHLGRGPAVPKTAAATPGPSQSPAVAKMARAKAAPAKKAAKAVVDPRAVAQLADEANRQPPGPGRVQAITATMEGLNGTQLRAVARELGVKVPPRMTPDAMREFIARSLDAFGS